MSRSSFCEDNVTTLFLPFQAMNDIVTLSAYFKSWEGYLWPVRRTHGPPCHDVSQGPVPFDVKGSSKILGHAMQHVLHFASTLTDCVQSNS